MRRLYCVYVLLTRTIVVVCRPRHCHLITVPLLCMINSCGSLHTLTRFVAVSSIFSCVGCKLAADHGLAVPLSLSLAVALWDRSVSGCIGNFSPYVPLPHIPPVHNIGVKNLLMVTLTLTLHSNHQQVFLCLKNVRIGTSRGSECLDLMCLVVCC